MTILNRLATLEPRLTAWRRDIHAHPETAFEEHRTAAFVAATLRDLGLEVTEGLAGTGVVGVLRGAEAGPTVGLRADMDALPVTEATELPYCSTHPGRMHACGHDGHTAMLLGAAAALAAEPPARGTVVFIFQPAEETEGGGRVMIEEGLFERFPVDGVYGLHNWPGLPSGQFAVRPGTMMAAQDTFELRLIGRGGHAAMPHQGVDPITVAAQVHGAWQSIISRVIEPTQAAVISITQIHAGDTWNVIPNHVVLRGTVRSLVPEVRDQLETEMAHRARLIAEAHRATAEFDYQRRYPATINTTAEAELAAAAARDVAGADAVRTDLAPSMGAEDFGFMLEARPGAYAWIGNGDGARLHNPGYDFNDAILTTGVAYWLRVTERALAS